MVIKTHLILRQAKQAAANALCDVNIFTRLVFSTFIGIPFDKDVKKAFIQKYNLLQQNTVKIQKNINSNVKEWGTSFENNMLANSSEKNGNHMVF